MNVCRDLLKQQIRDFENESPRHWVDNDKPTLAEEMGQLKYNACTEAYELICQQKLDKQDAISFFGQELYDEVRTEAYERQYDF